MAAGNEVMLDNLPLSAFNIAKHLTQDPQCIDPKLNPFTVAHDNASLYQYFEQNPDQGRKFAAHMRAQSSTNGTTALQSAYPWSDLPPSTTLTDCGGSFGSTALAIHSSNPHIKITIQDLPKVIESARFAASKDPQWPTNITFQTHSFLDPQPLSTPPANIYLYRMVFHNWSDDGARKILTAIRASLQPGTKLILIEYVMPSSLHDDIPSYAHLQTRRVDNMMYTLMGGKVRTLEEFQTLVTTVVPELVFQSYKRGEFGVTHDPRSHGVLVWEVIGNHGDCCDHLDDGDDDDDHEDNDKEEAGMNTFHDEDVRVQGVKSPSIVMVDRVDRVDVV